MESFFHSNFLCFFFQHSTTKNATATTNMKRGRIGIFWFLLSNVPFSSRKVASPTKMRDDDRSERFQSVTSMERTCDEASITGWGAANFGAESPHRRPADWNAVRAHRPALR